MPGARKVTSLWLLLAIVLLLGSGSLVGFRLTRPIPAPDLQLEFTAHQPDLPVSVPIPPLSTATGSLLVSDTEGKVYGAANANQVRPIASVAKTLTALVVLEKYPLQSATDEGPIIIMTQTDVADYQAVVAAGGSSVPVTDGEALTEKQLLLGLMLPSANNFANSLARWVSGDQASFVVLLNQKAQALKMQSTHYVDASGFSPQTVSTAADLLKLGNAVLANSSLEAIVATKKATLPNGTVVQNLDWLLSSQVGWLGIKTGETSLAGGCLLFAVSRPIGSAGSKLVVGAVLGQADLANAQSVAASTANVVLGNFHSVVLNKYPPSIKGGVDTEWGDSSSLYLGNYQGQQAVIMQSGTQLQFVEHQVSLQAPIAANTKVAQINVVNDGKVVGSWSVKLVSTVNSPRLFWKLTSR